ncbi:IS1193%2C transposase%2C ISL3 family [Streptococcus pneumoniae]|nr:IS1193%2C transposase%2C ISL3 family [Streptococcus pneumoniae]
MEQLKNTTDLLGLEDKNIKILSVLKYQTHLVVQAKLDSPAPPCPHCQGKMIKYDFQKASKIPPIEQVWKEIRKRGFKNKAFRTLEDVMNQLQDVIQGLEKEVIKSIVNRRWTRMLFESR